MPVDIAVGDHGEYLGYAAWCVACPGWRHLIYGATEAAAMEGASQLLEVHLRHHEAADANAAAAGLTTFGLEQVAAGLLAENRRVNR